MNEVLKEILEERRQIKSLPVLATRYSVIEVSESLTDDHGHYLPPDPRRVSPFFGNEADALKWMENNQREGFRLTVRVQYLREFTEQRWSSF